MRELLSLPSGTGKREGGKFLGFLSLSGFFRPGHQAVLGMVVRCPPHHVVDTTRNRRGYGMILLVLSILAWGSGISGILFLITKDKDTLAVQWVIFLALVFYWVLWTWSTPQ